ncbi:hypothetical protein YPPY42_3701, partial [Yersinia pestis PY-42]
MAAEPLQDLPLAALPIRLQTPADK